MRVGPAKDDTDFKAMFEKRGTPRAPKKKVEALINQSRRGICATKCHRAPYGSEIPSWHSFLSKRGEIPGSSEKKGHLNSRYHDGQNQSVRIIGFSELGFEKIKIKIKNKKKEKSPPLFAPLSARFSPP